MFDRYAELQGQLQGLLTDSGNILAETGADTASRVLYELASDLDRVNYTVAVIGFMKRGKSTLVNALMRRPNDDIAPIGSLPCSSVITQYVDRRSPEEPERARVYFQDPNTSPIQIDLASIRDYNTERGNPGNRKNVQCIEVIGDFPALHQIACLVDTPGKGSINADHDAMTDFFLPKADAIILVISADLPIEKSEKDFLKQLSQQEKDRIFVVLTMADELTEKDKKAVLGFVAEQLRDTGLKTGKIHVTAAKPVFTALRENQPQEEVASLAEKWGISELERAIEDHVLRHSDQSKAFARRCGNALVQCTERTRETLRAIDTDLAKLGANKAELLAESEKFAEKTRGLRNGAAERLRIFEQDWNKSVSRFKREAKLKATPITTRILKQLGEESLLKVWSRQPAVMVSKILQPEIDGLCLELANKLSEATSVLEKDIGGDLEVYADRQILTDPFAQASNNNAKMLALSGGVIAVGQSAYFASTAASAWMAASAAKLAASSTAGVASAEAVTGALASAYYWLVGGGAVGAANASAAAVSAASTAATAVASTAVTTAAISTGVGALVIAVGVLVTSEVLNQRHTDRIPGLVETQIDDMLKIVDRQLAGQRDAIKKTFTSLVEDEIRSSDKRLTEVLAAINGQDPNLKPALESRRDRLIALLARSDGVDGALRLLIGAK